MSIEDPRILCDGRLYLPFNPECPWCDGTGLDEQAYRDGQSKECSYCKPQWLPLAEYGDEDRDGWLDGVHQVRARYADAAGSLPLHEVDTIVLHRLARGRGEAGPRYVKSLGDDRSVSWHFTIHHEGFERPLTQHVPLERKAWHAGRINSTSLGIELDAHPSGDVHASYDDPSIQTLVNLIRSLEPRLPSLARIVSHRSIAPGRRSDPGIRFPWAALEPLGVMLVP